MAESIEQVEFKLGSTIYFHVSSVEPSETKWFLNKTESSITHERGTQFINRKATDFSDSGLYECKVDDKTIKAFYVIVYDFYKCDLGSTIDLRVNTVQCQEWTLNNKKVTSAGDHPIGFVKKGAAIEDSGRYECKVDGKVKCAFYVLVYDFDEGMFPPDEIGAASGIPIKTIKEGFKHNKQRFRHEAPQEVLNKFYDETNKEVSVFFNKEEKTGFGGKTYYKYDVIYHEYYECEAGSRLHLRYKKGSVSPTWSLNEVDALSDCDPQEGFEKKKADIKDSGKYECTVDGRVMRIFDVIVYGTDEVNFGETIHLEVEENLKCPSWTLNGKNVSSECDPQKGFEKTNADFTDSGKYRCIVGNTVSNVFQVIVYEYLFEDEFIGIRISVTDEATGKKPGILSKQNRMYGNENISQQKFETKQTDDPKKQDPPEDDPKKQDPPEDDSKKQDPPEDDPKQQDPPEDDPKKPDPPEDDPKQQDPPEDDPKRQDPPEDDPKKPDPPEDDPKRQDPPEDDPDIHDPPRDDPDIHDPPRDAMQIPAYMMNRNPRGLAVIMSIGEFDDEGILNLVPMTRADAGYCVDTFRHFNFLIRESFDNTRRGILQFLRAIANEDHSNSDCLVLYVSSHGANGYFCCRDFNRNGTGFITYNEMLSIFLPVQTLAEKPKLIFIDSCRHVQVANLEIQVPIGIVNIADLERHFANILVGYATIVGAAARGTATGSFYTIELTRCIWALAANNSILDVMTAVINCMMNRHQRTSECQFSLNRRLVLRLPAPAPAR